MGDGGYVRGYQFELSRKNHVEFFQFSPGLGDLAVYKLGFFRATGDPSFLSVLPEPLPEWFGIVCVTLKLKSVN